MEKSISIKDIKCTSKEGHNMFLIDIGRKGYIKMTDYVCSHCGLLVREKTEMLLLQMGRVKRKKDHRNWAKNAALSDISKYIKNSPEYETHKHMVVTAEHLRRDKDITKLNAELGINTINKTPEKMRRSTKKHKSIYEELGNSYQKTGFIGK